METRSPTRLFEDATIHSLNSSTSSNHTVLVVTSESLRNVPAKKRSQVRTVIDTLGERSAKAQRLPSVITTMGKVLEAKPSQSIYLCVDRSRVLGFLKFGKKHLFLTTPQGKWLERDFDCLLDFYVHESCQRQGIGYLLFSSMLSYQGLEAKYLAYDRPSEKLLPFLRRYFNLRSFMPQNNNYVVFDRYYHDDKSSQQKNTPSAYHHRDQNDSIDRIMNQSFSFKTTPTTRQDQRHDDGKSRITTKVIVNTVPLKRRVGGGGGGGGGARDFLNSSSSLSNSNHTTTNHLEVLQHNNNISNTTTTSDFMDSLSNLIGSHSARRYCSMTEAEREHLEASRNSSTSSSVVDKTSSSHLRSNTPLIVSSSIQHPFHTEREKLKERVLLSERFDREANLRRARGGLILG